MRSWYKIVGDQYHLYSRSGEVMSLGWHLLEWWNQKCNAGIFQIPLKYGRGPLLLLICYKDNIQDWKMRPEFRVFLLALTTGKMLVMHDLVSGNKPKNQNKKPASEHVAKIRLWTNSILTKFKLFCFLHLIKTRILYNSYTTTELTTVSRYLKKEELVPAGRESN